MRNSLVFLLFPIILPIIHVMMWWEVNINRNPSGGKTIAGPYAFNKPSIFVRIKDYLSGKHR